MLWVLIRSASSHKSICCGYSLEAPREEALLMSTHNIRFRVKKKTNNCGYHHVSEINSHQSQYYNLYVFTDTLTKGLCSRAL